MIQFVLRVLLAARNTFWTSVSHSYTSHGWDSIIQFCTVILFLYGVRAHSLSNAIIPTGCAALQNSINQELHANKGN